MQSPVDGTARLHQVEQGRTAGIEIKHVIARSTGQGDVSGIKDDRVVTCPSIDHVSARTTIDGFVAGTVGVAANVFRACTAVERQLNAVANDLVTLGHLQRQEHSDGRAVAGEVGVFVVGDTQHLLGTTGHPAVTGQAHHIAGVARDDEGVGRVRHVAHLIGADHQGVVTRARDVPSFNAFEARALRPSRIAGGRCCATHREIAHIRCRRAAGKDHGAALRCSAVKACERAVQGCGGGAVPCCQTGKGSSHSGCAHIGGCGVGQATNHQGLARRHVGKRDGGGFSHAGTAWRGDGDCAGVGHACAEVEHGRGARHG